VTKRRRILVAIRFHYFQLCVAKNQVLFVYMNIMLYHLVHLLNALMSGLLSDIYQLSYILSTNDLMLDLISRQSGLVSNPYLRIYLFMSVEVKCVKHAYNMLLVQSSSYHYHANINCTNAGSATGANNASVCLLIGYYQVIGQPLSSHWLLTGKANFTNSTSLQVSVNR
jgi:hypothetical protein